STSALAGSQAAQHGVSGFPSALSGPLARAATATPANRASAPPAHFDHLPVVDFRMWFPLLTHSLAAIGSAPVRGAACSSMPVRACMRRGCRGKARARLIPWAASRRDVQFSLILNIRYQFAKPVKRGFVVSKYVFRCKVWLQNCHTLHMR